MVVEIRIAKTTPTNKTLPFTHLFCDNIQEGIIKKNH